MGLFGDITDSMGLTDTGAGGKAAERAAFLKVISQQKARGELLPAFKKARNELTSSADLSRDALSGGFNDSQDIYRQSLERATGTLNPLTTAGLGSLGMLQEGATQEGFARNINSLMSGGALDPLIAHNRRNLEAELSLQGLGRSGAGLTEMSQLPINTVMGIESQLYGRQGDIAGRTLPAIMAQANLESSAGNVMGANRYDYGQSLSGLEGNIGANLSNLELTKGQNLADIERGIGDALSSGVLAKAQADAADRAVLGEVLAAERANLHDFGMSFMDMGGMMGGG